MVDIRHIWVNHRDENLGKDEDQTRRRKLAAQYLRDETSDMPMDLRNAIAEFLDELGRKGSPGQPRVSTMKWYEIGQFLDEQEKRNVDAAARHFGVSRDTVRRAEKYYNDYKKELEEAEKVEQVFNEN